MTAGIATSSPPGAAASSSSSLPARAMMKRCWPGTLLTTNNAPAPLRWAFEAFSSNMQAPRFATKSRGGAPSSTS